MDSPRTPEEWWQLLRENLGNVRQLVAAYHPGVPEDRKKGGDMTITAAGAEALCSEYREEIAQRSCLPVQRFDLAVKAGNHTELIDLGNETWFGMPESSEVRSEPGFFALCDLC